MKSNPKPKGIRERIAVSTSPTEIGTLVHTALEFEHASPKTIRRIRRTAKVRLAALERDGIGQGPERRSEVRQNLQRAMLATALILGGIR